MSLYSAASAAGLMTGHHESDLYLHACRHARALCRYHGARYTVIVDQTTGLAVLDVPFYYQPFWDAKEGRKPGEREP